MITLKTPVRKWGDSVAVIIPKKLADAAKINAEDTVIITIKKEVDLFWLFGKLKIKKSAQQLKDESREGWE